MSGEAVSAADALARANARIAALEAQLAAAQRDLQHRMRNMLAIVRSIARRSAGSGESAQDYQMHLDGRLAALGRVQSVLLQDAGDGADLEALIAAELAAFGPLRDERLRIEGPAARLKPKPAELIGLAVHELATNAVKFGALAVPEGRIAIEWAIETDGVPASLRLDWRESGVALTPANERHRGFGTELLQDALAYELAGISTIEIFPGGLFCRIRLPQRCLVGS